jgi:diguanylate cyclase (GGDEF)-like protein
MSKTPDITVAPCSCEQLVTLTSPDSFEGLHGAMVEVLSQLHPDCRVLLYAGVYREETDANELLACAGRTQAPPAECETALTRQIEDDRTHEPLATLLIYSDAPVEVHPDMDCLIQVYKHQCHHIRQATSDKLTGLMNRDLLDHHLQSIYDELRRGERRDTGKRTDCALAFIDIDNFKRINDQHGHLMGDEVLLLISQLMNKTFRENDLLFRFGGEEFIVILRYCDRDNAQWVLERFRKAIENFKFPFTNQITVSIGFTMIEPIVNYDVMISRADKALYYVKEHGKNACGCYENLVETNAIVTHVPNESDVELF